MTAALPSVTSLEHLLGTVGEAMTPQVVSLRIPVVDHAGRPVGILTRDDVLRVLARRIRNPQAPRMEPD